MPNLPNKKSTTKKYSISEVASLLQVSTQLLRKWETLGYVCPLRNERGYRIFTPQDISKLKDIIENRSTKQYAIKRNKVVKQAKSKKEATKIQKKIKGMYWTAIGSALTLATGIFLLALNVTGLQFTKNKILGMSKITSPMADKSVMSAKDNIRGEAVLGQRDKAVNYEFNVNVPTNLVKGVNVGSDAEITGDASIYGFLYTSSLNLTGTGSLSGLDEFDTTTKDTLETTLEVAGDVTGTLGATTIAPGTIGGLELAEAITYAGTITFEGDIQTDSTVNLTGEVQADGDEGSDGQVLSSTGSGVEWIDIDGDSDAETLDSIEPGEFLRSNTSDAYTSGTLSFSDGTFLDLSAIKQNDTAVQGLKLPQGTTLASPSSGEGYLAYDTDDDTIYIYNGSSWASISGSSTTLQEAYVAGNQIALSASEGDIRFYNDGSAEMLFLDESNGRIGIGNTAPDYKLDITGTLQATGFRVNSETVTDFSGTGITVTGGALTSTLGTSIVTGEITDDTILEVDFDATNSPTDGLILSFDNATGGFTWIPNDGGSGASKWTDGGATTYLTSTTDDLAVGGTSLASSVFAIDESEATFYVGYDNSSSPEFLFEASDGDQGTFGFNTNDAFYISGANFIIGAGAPGYEMDVTGEFNADTIYINDSQVTSTATELNLLDGTTTSTTEFNLLTGRTGTLLDTNNVASQLSAWDQNSSDDLTTATSFSGDVSGLYNNLQIGSGAVGTTEIADDDIQEVDLEVTNAPTDNYILTYDSGTAGFTWVDNTSVGTNYWNRDGTLLKPLADGDDIATAGNIGAGTTNPSAALHVVGNIVVTGTVDGKDIATNAAMLNEAETISSNWVNTANPWADNEVSDTLTIGASGSVSDSALSSNVSLLGQTIETGEITDDEILEVDLDLTNSPTDNYILSYDSGSGGFTWVEETGGSGASKWTDGGTTTYLTSLSDDLGIGHSGPSSELFFDTSASALTLNPFGAASGNTGEIRFSELVANGSSYTGFKAPDSLASNIIYEMPNTNGSADYVLTWQTGGALEWKEVTGVGGAGDITAVGSMGTGAVFADATADDDWLGLGAAAGRIEFDDQTTDEVNIQNANVGIGTTTPSATLDVAGRIAQTGLGTATYLGKDAGLNDSSLNGNTGIGYEAMLTNSTGNQNTAVGYSTLKKNTSGYNNVGVGGYALTENTTGFSNTAVGNSAMYWNDGGDYNSAHGTSALNKNTSGYDNTGMGFTALFSNTNGFENTGIGSKAGYSTTTGDGNTSLGTWALYRNTTGNYNTAIGVEAGRYITGGSNNTTGSNNIFIGYDTRAFADGDSNEVVIGHQAIGIGSNSVVLGNDSITKTVLKGNVGIGTTDPSYALDIVGISQSSSGFRTNSETVTDFSGTGITVSAGAITADLGTSIETGEITNDEILEVDFDVTNSPTDNYVLSYDESSGGFTWIIDDTGSGDGDEKVGIDSGATAGYLGAASNDGVLRTSSPISYADGGDYITLGITNDAVGDTQLAFNTGQHLTTTSTPTFDTVTASTSASIATLNSVATVDSTTENTVEAAIFDSDAQNISGVWEVQDNTRLDFGNDADFGMLYDESSDDRFEFVDAGNNVLLDITDQGTTAEFAFNVDDFFIDDNGNVGIGTTAPSSLLSMSSTSTSTGFTGFDLDWSPGSSTTLTGDLFSINIGANGSADNLFAIYDNSSDVFTVTETQITSAVPHQFTASGDVSMSYDLIMANQTASKIETYGPFEIEVGQDFENNDFALTTYGTGALVVNAAGGSEFTRSGATVATYDRTSDDGTIISLKQAGTEEGTISVSGATVSYNGFTGSHYAWADQEVQTGLGLEYDATTGKGSADDSKRGLLVTLTGVNNYLNGSTESEILYGMDITTTENDTRVLGAYLAPLEINIPVGTSNPLLVTAVGNADIWVVDTGEDIQRGDYLVASSTPGHAQLDNNEYEISYIVARAAENVEWLDVDSVVEGTDTKHKRISIFFESFTIDRNSTLENIAVREATIQGLQTEVALINTVLGITAVDEEAASTLLSLTEEITTIYNQFKELVEGLGLTKTVDTEGNDVLAINSDLTVTGTTALADLTITGDVMAGLIKIDTINNSIGIVGPECEGNEDLCEVQTLYLQRSLAGNVDILDGAIIVEPSGDTQVKGTLTTNKLAIETEEENDKSAGKAVITAGETSVEVTTTALTDTSLVLVTPKGAPVAVSTVNIDSDTFEIRIESEKTEDITVDWLIVDIN